MDTMSEKVIEIEKKYFTLIYDLFYELILFYEKEGISIVETVKAYLFKQKQNTLYIPEFKDNHSYKRHQMYEKNKAFWNSNKNTVINFISTTNNVGVFGIGDNTFASDYLDEIKRNSLFYDVLVFNDPFYTAWATNKEFDIEQNIFLFYCNILYIWQLKQYLSVENNEVFTILFPFDCLITNEKKINFINESHNAAVSWIKEIFDITLNEKDFVSDIEKVKALSIGKIQNELLKNGIYQNYVEALNYSQNLLDENEKRKIESLCYYYFGTFNKELVRGLLTLTALPSMATVNYYEYKLHSFMSIYLKSNAIMSINEWEPLKRELKNKYLEVSNNYKYTCAIHRNDQMAALMKLDYEEIVQYHNKEQCIKFREFFNKATNEIVKTHVDVDDIANEVFSRIDELLEKQYKDILSNKKQMKKNAIIGFLKGSSGFLPILSYAISAMDMGGAIKDYTQTLKNEKTLIEYLYTRKNN